MRIDNARVRDLAQQAATAVADVRFQLIDTHLAAAQVAISAAWNLMPPDTPWLLRERCKQIEGDIIDAADILTEIREAQGVES